VYFLLTTLFNRSSLVAHLWAFGLFFILSVLVYKLLKYLAANKTAALIGVCFYTLSAAHFSHLMSIANQELIHGIFFVLTLIGFIRLLKTDPTSKKQKS